MTEVLDLRTEDAQRRVGLARDDLVSPVGAQDSCQRVGRVAHQLGLHGVIAPAATGLGETLASLSSTSTSRSSLDCWRGTMGRPPSRSPTAAARRRERRDWLAVEGRTLCRTGNIWPPVRQFRIPVRTRPGSVIEPY